MDSIKKVKTLNDEVYELNEKTRRVKSEISDKEYEISKIKRLSHEKEVSKITTLAEKASENLQLWIDILGKIDGLKIETYMDLYDKKYNEEKEKRKSPYFYSSTPMCFGDTSGDDIYVNTLDISLKFLENYKTYKKEFFKYFKSLTNQDVSFIFRKLFNFISVEFIIDKYDLFEKNNYNLTREKDGWVLIEHSHDYDYYVDSNLILKDKNMNSLLEKLILMEVFNFNNYNNLLNNIENKIVGNYDIIYYDFEDEDEDEDNGEDEQQEEYDNDENGSYTDELAQERADYELSKDDEEESVDSITNRYVKVQFLYDIEQYLD